MVVNSKICQQSTAVISGISGLLEDTFMQNAPKYQAKGTQATLQHILKCDDFTLMSQTRPQEHSDVS